MDKTDVLAAQASTPLLLPPEPKRACTSFSVFPPEVLSIVLICLRPGCHALVCRGWLHFETVRSRGRVARTLSDTLQRSHAQLVAAAAASSSAAAVDTSAPFVLELAERIEAALFALSGRVTGRAYNRKARRLVYNLSPKRKNSTLAGRVLRGLVTPTLLVSLGPDALAGQRLQEERTAARQKSVKAATVDKYETWTPTDELYCCPRCSSHKCMYRIWRRTGDRFDRYRTEVRCTVCDNRWDNM